MRKPTPKPRLKGGLVLCTTCKRYKPPQDFHKARESAHSLAYRCKICNYKRQRKYIRKLGMNGETRRLRQYRLTQSDYNAMLQEQGGVCALCQRLPSTYFNVDHCHKTGIVRALLCVACNHGIGLLQDNPERLRKAAAYIEQHAANPRVFRCSITPSQRPDESGA